MRQEALRIWVMGEKEVTTIMSHNFSVHTIFLVMEEGKIAESRFKENLMVQISVLRIQGVRGAWTPLLMRNWKG